MKGFFKKLGLFTRKESSSHVIKASVRQVQYTERQKNAKLFTQIIGVIGLAFFCLTVLAFSIRGVAGNPTPEQLNTKVWKEDGPLELSPERGRYALLYSVVENKSFTFSQPIAAFSTPDVGYHKGAYVSLFAPGVSFLTIPGYYLGKAAGLAQVGTYAVIALFAVCNFFLIRAIAIRMGASHTAAAVGAAAFLFASPAFAYAVTLYQHHISTFLILLSIYLLMRFTSIYSLLAIWVLCGLSVVVDYPNFFMMLPIGLYALGRTFLVERKEQLIKLSIPLLRVLAIAVVLVPLLFFFKFNELSYGNPLTLSGTVERAIEVKPDGSPILESEIMKEKLGELGEFVHQDEVQSIGTFFHPRNLMTGFYTHFISLDRGLMFYTPVMLFGMAGLLFYRKQKYLSLFTAIIGFNIVLYSMWGDPYGGWAFGSRYLIPTYAILAIFIATLLTKLNRHIIFMAMFFLMFSYSVGVNTLGAITSNRNPPQIETDQLAKVSGVEQPYTYERNMQMLDSNISKSFVYQTYAKDHVSAWEYYFILTGFIIGTSAIMLMSIVAPRYGFKKTRASAKSQTAAFPERKEYYAV